MKYIYAPDVLPHIEKLADAWNAVDRAGGYDFLEGTLNYVFTAANVKDYNKLFHRRCEERSDEAIQEVQAFWIASLRSQ